MAFGRSSAIVAVSIIVIHDSAVLRCADSGG